MKNKKVNILGKDWKIEFKKEAECDEILQDSMGYADCANRKIVILELQEKNGSTKSAKIIMNKTLRHEIVHATLFESGLHNNVDWAQNEECVDWIALQFPKLLSIFKKVEMKY